MVVSYTTKESRRDETTHRWCEKFGASVAHSVKIARCKPTPHSRRDVSWAARQAASAIPCGTLRGVANSRSAWCETRYCAAEASRHGFGPPFSQTVLASGPNMPRGIVIDQPPATGKPKLRLRRLANVKHVFVKASPRVNNRAENSHRPGRAGDCRGCGFRDPRTHPEILVALRPNPAHLALRQHLRCVSLDANNSVNGSSKGTFY